MNIGINKKTVGITRFIVPVVLIGITVFAHHNSAKQKIERLRTPQQNYNSVGTLPDIL
jgi:hypothetical protein